MPFKTVLTHVVADRKCAQRLRMVAAVARAFDAHIVGLGAQAPWPFASDRDGGGRDFQTLVRGVRHDLSSTRRTFERHVAEANLASEWREEVAYPDAAIPRHARVADLVVAYRTGWDSDRIAYAAADTVLMEAGVPVLLLPARESEFNPQSILLAWKNSREARRAITATLPLLKAAARVVVVSVSEKRGRADAEAELSDVATRLARHGVSVVTRAETGSSDGAAKRLLSLARSEDCGLIVAGGFAHSRMREWVLGGVTRDLLADSSRYVLLVH